MYGCIVGKDTEGIWLLAEGPYQKLQENISIYKKLNESMDIRLFNIDEYTMREIKSDLKLIKEKFSGLFV